MSLPDSLVWVVVASGLCVILPISGLGVVGANGLIIMTVIYFFKGFDIIKFKFIQWKISPLFRFMILPLIFINAFMLGIVSAIGLASVYVDFTKPKNIKD
jgi:hypothetical protein